MDKYYAGLLKQLRDTIKKSREKLSQEVLLLHNNLSSTKHFLRELQYRDKQINSEI